jgi:ABC-type transport system involved in Fe-S cluster assembly fused permease/ATPase subunit
LPAVISTTWLQFHTLLNSTKKGKEANETASKIACEAVAAMRTVVSLNVQDKLAELYDIQLDIPYRVGKRRALVASFGLSLGQAVVYLVNAILFASCLRAFKTKKKTSADVVPA